MEAAAHHDAAVGQLANGRDRKLGTAAARRVDGHDDVVGVAARDGTENVDRDLRHYVFHEAVDVRRGEGLGRGVGRDAHRFAQPADRSANRECCTFARWVGVARAHSMAGSSASSERTTSIFCDESQRGILRNTTSRLSATEHRHRFSTVQISALGQLVRAPEMEKCGKWRDASSCPTGHAHFSGVSVLRHSSQTSVMEMVSKSLPPVESVSSNILDCSAESGVSSGASRWFNG